VACSFKNHIVEEDVMKNNNYAGLMSAAEILLADRELNSAGMAWNEHPKFRGVFLKHLVCAADTAGQLSCHIVKVDAGCELALHEHPDQWELHEVLSGEGLGTIGGCDSRYFPQRMAVIPNGVPHRVTAGGEGLVLLAKFFPALL